LAGDIEIIADISPCLQN